MEKEGIKGSVSKYISIVHRLSYPYFDKELSAYHIGSGQQFFLLSIYESPGISMLELAARGLYDKGTTNRAVMKLEEQNYIKVETDKEDKRIRRLYLTDKALPIINSTYGMLGRWNHMLTENFTEQERGLVQQLMKKMADNAHHFMNTYRKKE